MRGQSTNLCYVCERCGNPRPKQNKQFCSHACKNAPKPLILHPTDPTITIVPLTKGKVALVDTADAERVGRFNWQAHWNGKAWYASRNPWPVERAIYLHRFLMDAPDGIEVDHIDGDTLDCRRSKNLRIATHQENQCNLPLRIDNASGYKGVRWHPRMAQWEARITANGRMTKLGYFDDAREAALAYDAAAREAFGAFARTNFP